jgi:hypothetical protein
MVRVPVSATIPKMGGQNMQRLAIAVACAILALSLSTPLSARDPARLGLRPAVPWTETELPHLEDPNLRELNMMEAAVDTYCIVWYDFETMNWQGWTRLDRTAQQGTFFHVDDFAGLGGGDFGGLVPLEGTKSMWCGVRSSESAPYVCGFLNAPGYGNDWDQELRTGPRSFVGIIGLSYKLSWDCEPDYDYVRIQYDAGNGDWQTLASYTGDSAVVDQVSLATTQAATKLRFHFDSDGAWSDEDGLHNTDGACIVDSIRVWDSSGYFNFEDFETAAVGALGAGIWEARPGIAFGLYSGLKYNLSIGDRDPCNVNFSTQIVFFIGSPVASTGYPGLYDTPFCKGPGGVKAPCQDEAAVSPVIDLNKYSTGCNEYQDGTIAPADLPLLGGLRLKYTVYVDNPAANLVLWNWEVRGIDDDGCPGPWLSQNFLYWYWENGVYTFSTVDLSAFVTSDKLQVSLGIYDMCDVWYLQNGNCAQHTPAPWYDNVRLYRYKSEGPQWSYRDIDLFQDNFPDEEFVLESYVRADAANDINTNDYPVIRPGDSVVVECRSPLGGGLAADPGGGPAIYMHVKCTYIGPVPAKPALSGPSLQGTYGAYKSDDGTWTIIQGDTAAVLAPGNDPYRYMFDLNDSLFTRGYQIDYYFTARDNAGIEKALPKWCRSYGPYFEFTCLPTKNSEVLFVDDFHGRGSFAGAVENYWIPTFHSALSPPNNWVDRYDVNGPTSGVSNGPGSRAKTKQIVDWYTAIVWDCGDLSDITISDGTVNSDKSNDCQMLIDWFEQSEHKCGLWVCGDDVAFDLDGLSSTPALTLMSTWCGVDVVNTSYFELTGGKSGGGIVSPLLTGEIDAGIFVHGGIPDKFYVMGGCPMINWFDVLDKTANGMYALSYPAYGGTNRYAAIASSQLNPGGFAVNTMWFGFSLMYVRDDMISAPIDRFEIAKDVFAWMQFPTNICCGQPPYVDADVPAAYRLAQNFPNPFNPVTTIKFDMKEKGNVTLRIYNVAGELVRTLVDDVRDAGAYAIEWDGRNNGGSNVATGVYFYKMETNGFNETKKMVMLR